MKPSDSRAVVRPVPIPSAPQNWWDSPHAQYLIQAGEYLAIGQPLRAALYLEERVRELEGRGVPITDYPELLRMVADAWQRAASHALNNDGENLRGVRHRIRTSYLSNARDAYRLLRDFKSEVRTLRHMADSNLTQGHPVAAMKILEFAFNLSRTYSALDVFDVPDFFQQLSEACKSVFEKHVMQRHPEPLVEGPKAAAHMFLFGQSVQSKSYLEDVAEKYIHVARDYHRRALYGSAFDVLVQGVFLQLSLGRADAIAEHADAILQYSILTGNEQSHEVYDRAIHLAQMGAAGIAEGIIHERALSLLVRQDRFVALKLFLKSMEEGLMFVTQMTENVLFESNPNPERIMAASLQQMQAAFRYAMAWTRVIEVMGPLYLFSTVRRLGREGVAQIESSISVFKRGMLTASAVHPSASNYNAGSPELLKVLMLAQREGPAGMTRAHLMLAIHLGCTPAEVASVFTPYGDARIEARLRQATGDMVFEQFRYMTLNHHFKSVSARLRKPKIK